MMHRNAFLSKIVSVSNSKKKDENNYQDKPVLEKSPSIQNKPLDTKQINENQKKETNAINKSDLDLARERWDIAARLDENSSIVAGGVSTSLTLLFEGNENEAGLIGTFIGAMVGVFVAAGWLLFRKKLPSSWQQKLSSRYPNRPNPWSRRAKTMYIFGQKIGECVGNFIPLPSHPAVHFTKKIAVKILGCAFGIIFGVLGICGFKPGFSEKTARFFKIGKDSWTKYCKAGIVAGSCAGTLVGWALGVAFPPLGAAAGIAIGSAIGAIAGFLITAAIVPLIHYITGLFSHSPAPLSSDDPEQDTIKDQHSFYSSLKKYFTNYRTNYFRAGVTLGGCIGSVIGGVIGTFAFPLLGTFVGGTLGGAAGGLIGGIIFAIAGPAVSKRVDTVGSANTVDYALRTGSMLGGNTGVGQIASAFTKKEISTCIINGGGAVSGLLAVTREYFHTRRLKKTGEKEKDFLLPWTQSAATSIYTGAAIGGFIGMFICPPIGALIGSGLGGLIGAAFAIYVFPILADRFGCIPTSPSPPADILGLSEIPVVTQEKAEIEPVNTNMNQNVIEYTTSENLKKPPRFLEGHILQTLAPEPPNIAPDAAPALLPPSPLPSSPKKSTSKKSQDETITCPKNPFPKLHAYLGCSQSVLFRRKSEPGYSGHPWSHTVDQQIMCR